MKFKILLLFVLLVSCSKILLPDNTEKDFYDVSLSREDGLIVRELGCWEPSASNCGPGQMDAYTGYFSDCVQCDCVWVPQTEECEGGGGPNCFLFCGSTECVENKEGLALCEYEVMCARPECANYETSCDEYPMNLGTCITGGECYDCMEIRNLEGIVK